MKKSKDYCPYKDKQKCMHKDNHFNKNGNVRRCGYSKSPESCPMYLDWVELIDMDYLEKSVNLEPLNREIRVSEDQYG